MYRVSININWDRLDKDARTAARVGCRSVKRAAVARAKRLVPKASRALMRTIRGGVKVKDYGPIVWVTEGRSAKYGKEVKHGRVVEFGGPSKSRRHRTVSVKGRVVRRGRKNVNRDPRPFMLPALEGETDRFLRVFRKDFGSG